MSLSWKNIMRFMKGKMLRYMPYMITCLEFEDFIASYLEGDLPEEQMRRFELHLRICRECREYLAAYQRTIELQKAVFSDPDANIPKDIPEDLVKAVIDTRDLR